MTYKDSLRDFMARLGRGACVVLVLGPRYLKSNCCMYELTQIAKNGDLRGRVFPILLPSAKISDAPQRLKYVAYWEKKISTLNAQLKGLQQTKLTRIQEELNLYHDIRASFDDITDTLKDMNVRDLAHYRRSDFRELISAVERALATRRLNAG